MTEEEKNSDDLNVNIVSDLPLYDYYLQALEGFFTPMAINNFVSNLLAIICLALVSMKEGSTSRHIMKGPTITKYCLSFMLVSAKTIAYPFQALVICQGFYIFPKKYPLLIQRVFLHLMNSINAILFLFLLVYSQKLYKLCFPN